MISIYPLNLGEGPPGAWSEYLELVIGVKASVTVPVIMIMRLPLEIRGIRYGTAIKTRE